MTKKQNFIFVYLLMNTIMCLAMSLAGLLVNVGFRAAYFPAWWHAFPVMELVSVVVSLIAAPPAMKLARRAK